MARGHTDYDRPSHRPRPDPNPLQMDADHDDALDDPDDGLVWVGSAELRP